MPPQAANPFRDFVSKFQKFYYLVGVVLLQDMRTRYGGRSHLGYIFATMIPLLHMTVITGLYYLRTIVAPIGDNAGLFIATGIVPYILCIYPAREMPRAIFENRQLLAIPMLQPIHLMVSRALLQMLSAIIALAVFLLGLHLIDVDLAPLDLHEAARAAGAATFLGIGLGFFNTIMTAIFGPFFLVGFIFFAVGLYMLSGVYIPVTSMPENMREYVDYNPIFQLVEWMRAAYFTTYDMEPVNKTMVLGLALFGIAFGLIGERYIRGKILA
jgi:capsular polysaccharide transport system permease protein